jgi:hypothetical protein
MAEESTAGAAPSAAAEAPTFTQFDGWDEDGTPVVRNKQEATPEAADSATANEEEETTTEDGSEAESGEEVKQEKKQQGTRRRPDAEARIKELAARTKQLEKELAEARKGKETNPAEPSTAKPAETKPVEFPATRPKPRLDDKGPDGKPLYGTFEDHQEALTDWAVEQRLANRDREAHVQQQQQKWLSELNEARERYADFNAVAPPLVTELMKPDVPEVVREALMQSPVIADLLYTIGGTAASKADFLDACRNNPVKALRVALLMEQEIAAELGISKGAGKVAGQAGQGEGEAPPVTTKPRAPKPPSEVGGRGAPNTEDALVAAAKAGNFRAFDAEQTRRVLASRK